MNVRKRSRFGCHGAVSLFGSSTMMSMSEQRLQLAAAVAADRDQRELARVLAEVLRPRGLEQRVDEARAIAHQPFDRLVVVEALLEAVVAFGERAAERGDVGLLRRSVSRRAAGSPPR